MIRNWFISSLRFLIKDRVYTLINLGGIALGLTVVMVMALYITDEMGYDTFIPDVDRTYLLRYDEPRPDGSFEKCGIVGGGMVKALPNVFPEVEASTRVQMFGLVEFAHQRENGAWSRDKVELRTMRAEPSLFSIFPNQVLAGDSLGMLQTRRTCVVTESVAKRLFGNADPIGKQLGMSESDPYTVTAVVEDMPRKSSLQFDLLLPLLDQDRPWYADYETWAVNGYCRVAPGTDIRALELGIDKLVNENTEIQEATAHLVPLLDLHLKTRDMIFMNVSVNPGDIQQVFLLGLIAGVILLIATFNYVNLTTARAITRSREVGLRKTVGATRPMLLLHYMGESVLLVLASLVLAMGLSELLLPYVGNLLGRDLSSLTLFAPLTLLALVGVAVLIGLLAGLSRTDPFQLLADSCHPQPEGARQQPVTAAHGDRHAAVRHGGGAADRSDDHSQSTSFHLHAGYGVYPRAGGPYSAAQAGGTQAARRGAEKARFDPLGFDFHRHARNLAG